MVKFILGMVFPVAMASCDGGGKTAEKYMQAGFINFQKQEYDQAIANFQKAVGLEPRAAALFKKTLALNPQHPEKAQFEKMIAAGEARP